MPVLQEDVIQGSGEGSHMGHHRKCQAVCMTGSGIRVLPDNDTLHIFGLDQLQSLKPKFLLGNYDFLG